MRTEATEQYTIRLAEPGDAPQIAHLFREAYGHSSHPCQDATVISQSIAGKKDVWFVALESKTVVSCTAGVWHSWNRLYEASRSVTHPAYQHRGLGGCLLKRCFAHLYEKNDCDLILAVFRSSAMYRLVSESVERPFVLTGHDGGMNIANGLREYHFIGFTTNPMWAPQCAALLGNSSPFAGFIVTPILPGLKVDTRYVRYPDALIVGPTGAQCIRVGPWSISFNYDVASLHITDFTGPGKDLTSALDGLATCLRVLPEVEHIYAYVLMDKVQLVGGMHALGFQTTAYLPAWYCQGHDRYDCLMLTKCVGPEPPVAHGTSDWLALFDKGLNA
jgi:hypothetical protein